MSFLGGAIGGIVGGVGGFFVGGPVGAAVGAVGGYEVGDAISGNGSSSGMSASYPDRPDYSAAMVYESDNNKTIALAQIMSQKFAIQQASLDREMQNAANLELGIEKLDTKLQVAKLDFFQQMTGEQNRHVEKLAELGAGQPGAMALPSTDLPAPLFDEGY